MGSFCVLRLCPNPTVQRHGEIMILQGIIIRTLSVSSMSCSGVKRKNPVGRIFQSVTINKHENNFVKLCSRFYFPAMFTEIKVQQGYYYKQLLLVIALWKRLKQLVISLYFPRKMTNRCSSLLKQSLPNSDKLESQYMG